MCGLNGISGSDVSKEYIYKVQGQFRRLMIRQMEPIGELGMVGLLGVGRHRMLFTSGGDIIQKGQRVNARLKPG